MATPRASVAGRPSTEARGTHRAITAFRNRLALAMLAFWVCPLPGQTNAPSSPPAPAPSIESLIYDARRALDAADRKVPAELVQDLPRWETVLRHIERVSRDIDGQIESAMAMAEEYQKKAADIPSRAKGYALLSRAASSQAEQLARAKANLARITSEMRSVIERVRADDDAAKILSIREAHERAKEAIRQADSLVPQEVRQHLQEDKAK